MIKFENCSNVKYVHILNFQKKKGKIKGWKTKNKKTYSKNQQRKPKTKQKRAHQKTKTIKTRGQSAPLSLQPCKQATTQSRHAHG
jgi:hypothetical protein